MTLRHMIKFMEDNTPDGVQDPNYVDFATGIPANIVPVTGGERFRGRQLEATTTNVIELRNNPGITPRMIAVNELTGAEYLIGRILDQHGRDRYQIMECTENA